MAEPSSSQSPGSGNRACPNSATTRREFITTGAAAAGLSIVAPVSYVVGGSERTLRVWAMGCSHVGTDLSRGRASLAEAIRQAERGGDDGGPPFDWDIALHLGDLSGSQGPPDDEEGKEVVRQFGAARDHRREHFYNLAGNHDGSGPDEPTQWWFRKWVDPAGEQPGRSGVRPDRRPYPVEGTWERYSVRVGNLLFLMMSDRNDGGPPVGRGSHGGYPAGAVTSETFAWWRDKVEANPDAVVLSGHHHMLKETTVASGPWEGFKKGDDGEWHSHYHGYYPKGGPKGASYLYWLDETADAEAFEQYLADHPGATDLWLGGHTHTNPDDTTGGRSHVERKWGTGFINCAPLARYHVSLGVPMSRLLTFTEGRAEVRVACYLHTSQHAPQGWYPAAEATLPLGRPVELG